MRILITEKTLKLYWPFFFFLSCFISSEEFRTSSLLLEREIKSPTSSKQTPVKGHVQLSDYSASENSPTEKDLVNCLGEGQYMVV